MGSGIVELGGVGGVALAQLAGWDGITVRPYCYHAHPGPGIW